MAKYNGATLTEEMTGTAGGDSFTITEIKKNDTLDAGEGNDNITVTTMTGGIVSGGAGNDVITVKGTMSGGFLSAGEGSDTISVSTVKDSTLSGGAGQDRLTLKTVSATVTEKVPSAGSTQIYGDDVYTDTGENDVISITTVTGKKISDTEKNKVHISGDMFAAGEDAATVRGGNDTISITTAENAIIAGDMISLANNQTLNAGNDSITVKYLNDGARIYGEAHEAVSGVSMTGGNDTISVTTMSGDAKIYGDFEGAGTLGGNDKITVSTMNGTAIVDAGGGSDTVIISTMNGTAKVDAGAGSDSITVKTMNGAAQVDGGEGNDSLKITTMNTGTALYGGAGNDTVIISTMNGAATVNAGAGSDSISIGSMNSTPVKNGKVVTGYSGAAKVDAGDGDDTVSVSTMNAGTSLYGGAGNDSITIGSINGSSVKGGTVSVALGGGADTLTVRGTSKYADISGEGENSVSISMGAVQNSTIKLTGNTDWGNKNTLTLGSATDTGITLDDSSDVLTIKGTSKNVTIDAGYGYNSLTLGAVTGTVSKDGKTVTRSTLTTGELDDTLTLASAAYTDIELGNGANELTVKGSVRNSSITSTSEEYSRNSITIGSLGSSTVKVGAGNDFVEIGSFTDNGVSLDGGGDNYDGDTLSFGAGNDVVKFTDAALSADGGTITVGGRTVTIKGFERFTGGSGNNKLDASGVTDSTHGIHMYDGGVGNNTLIGGDGADKFIVSSNATITGGAGTDTFEIRDNGALSGTTKILIEDFKQGEDCLNLGYFGSEWNKSVSWQKGNTVTTLTKDKRTVIITQKGSALTGGDGSDLLAAGTLNGSEGDGKNRIDGDAGFDLIGVGTLSGTGIVSGGADADTIGVNLLTGGTVSGGADNDAINVTSMTGGSIFGDDSVAGNGDDGDTITVGTLSGGTIQAGAGDDLVVVNNIASGRGTSAKVIDGGSNSKGGRDTLSFGTGNDVVTFVAASENTYTLANDSLTTIKGFEQFSGGLGNDKLDASKLTTAITLDDGGAGADTLIASSNTTLRGNGGKDTFEIKDNGALTGTTKILIEDFTQGDSLDLSDFMAGDKLADGWTQSVSLQKNNDVITTLTKDKRTVIITQKGYGSKTQGTGNADLLAAGTLNGSEGAASIDGGAGADTIGVNLLTGGTVRGGADNDAINVTSMKGGIIYGDDANGDTDGNDTITVGTLYGGTIKGGQASDLVIVNNIASGGTKEIDGGEGGSTLSFGTGNDAVVFNTNGTITTNKQTVTVKGFEHFSGGSGNDKLDASKLTTAITLDDGGAGNNTLIGGTGADTLIASSNTTLTGGEGKDEYVIGLPSGTQSTTITITDYQSGEKINLDAFGNDEGLTWTKTEAVLKGSLVTTLTNPDNPKQTVKIVRKGYVEVTGEETADVIKVDSFSAGFVKGDAGNDTITVGALSGTASVMGGAGDDNITIASTNGGSINLDDGTNKLTIKGTSKDVTITGGAGADSITLGAVTGTAIEDNGTIVYTSTIDAGKGNDTLTLASATSADIDLSEGDDVLTIKGTSKDVAIIGGDGNDSMTLGAVTSAYINAGAGNDTLTLASATLTAIDLDAGDNSLTIKGTSKDVVIYGGAGADSMTLGAVTGSVVNKVKNVSTINAGAGNDTLTLASATYANIDLGAGDNSLTIKGTSKDVTITGGAGADSITLGAVTGSVINNVKYISTIDAGAGNDTLTLASATYADIDLGAGDNSLTIKGTSKDVTITGGAGADSITLGAVTGTRTTAPAGYFVYSSKLNTGAGADSITLGAVTGSSINTGAGNDTLTLASATYADINLGEGDNSLTIKGTSNTVSIIGGAGADSITLGAVTGSVVNKKQIVSTIDTGAGNDVITAGAVSNTTINTYEGDDVITVTTMNAGTNLFGGAGDDTITVQNLRGGYINAGAGNDVITLGSLSGTSTLSGGDGSDGTDTLNFTKSGKYTIGEMGITSGGRLIIKDIDAVNFSEGKDTLVLDGVTSGMTSLNMGDGADLVQVEAISALSGMTLSGGDDASKDTLTFTDKAGQTLTLNGDTLSGMGTASGFENIKLGTGADSIKVTSLTAGQTLDGGAGKGIADTLDLSAYDTEGDAASKTDGVAVTMTGGAVTAVRDAAVASSVEGGATNASLSGFEKIILSDADDSLKFSSFSGLTSGALTVDGGKGNNIVSFGPSNSNVVWNKDGTLSVNGVKMTLTNFKTFSGGTGNDTLNFANSTVGFNLSVGDDSVSRKNSITGGSGDDVLSVYGGNATLTGGAGADVFKVVNGDKYKGNINVTITDFKAGDRDVLDLSAFTEEDGWTNNGLTIVGGNTVTTLTKGEGKDKQTVTITQKDYIKDHATLTGGNTADTLSADTMASGYILGNGGNDAITVKELSGGTVDGGAGADSITITSMAGGTVKGGAGNDSVSIGTMTGGIVYGDEGDDTLAFTGTAGQQNLTLTSGTLGNIGGSGTASGFEHIQLGAGNDNVAVFDFSTGQTLDGGAGADTITVGSMTGGSLEGGVGNDSVSIGTMTGGNVDGGEGTDTLVFTGTAGQKALTLDGGTLTGMGEGTATGFEQIILGSGADSLTITTLNGGDIYSGDGNDTVTVTSMTNGCLTNSGGNDSITITNMTGGQVSGANNATAVDSIHIDTMSDGTVIGHSGKDVITVGTLSGGNVYGSGTRETSTETNSITVTTMDGGNVFGGMGSDLINITSMSGGSVHGNTSNISGLSVVDGDDSITIGTLSKGTVYGDDGNDSITVSTLAGGTVYGGAGHDSLTITSMAGGNVYGDEFNSTLAGADSITITSLTGGYVYGGAGDDSISITSMAGGYVYGGTGSEDNGTDTLAFTGTAGQTLTLNGGTLSGMGQGFATGFENIKLGTGADSIKVNSLTAGQTLDGGAGADTLDLSAYNTEGKTNGVAVTMTGGAVTAVRDAAVASSVVGGASTVSLSGFENIILSDAADSLKFSSFSGLTSGALTVDGGAGNNIVSFGPSNSNVVWNKDGTLSVNGVAMTLTNFNSFSGGVGNDTLNFANSTLGVNLSVGDDSVSTTNSITGGTGADTIGVYGGNATLTGGAGADVFKVVNGDKYTGNINVTITDFNAEDSLDISALTNAGWTNDGGKVVGNNFVTTLTKGTQTATITQLGYAAGFVSLNSGTTPLDSTKTYMLSGAATLKGTAGADSITVSSMDGGTVYGGAGKDNISIGTLAGGAVYGDNATPDTATGKDTPALDDDSITVTNMTGGNLYTGYGDDTVKIGTMTGGTVHVTGLSDAYKGYRDVNEIHINKMDKGAVVVDGVAENSNDGGTTTLIQVGSLTAASTIIGASQSQTMLEFDNSINAQNTVILNGTNGSISYNGTVLTNISNITRYVTRGGLLSAEGSSNNYQLAAEVRNGSASTIIGGSEDDLLYVGGKGGNVTLTGGAGCDDFQIDFRKNAAELTSDINVYITDFSLADGEVLVLNDMIATGWSHTKTENVDNGVKFTYGNTDKTNSYVITVTIAGETSETLNGTAGMDVLTTGFADVANGGDGDDLLTAEGFQSSLNGGAGDDTLVVGRDIYSTLTGGAGADRFVISGGRYVTITDFKAADGDILDDRGVSAANKYVELVDTTGDGNKDSTRITYKGDFNTELSTVLLQGVTLSQEGIPEAAVGELQYYTENMVVNIPNVTSGTYFLKNATAASLGGNSGQANAWGVEFSGVLTGTQTLNVSGINSYNGNSVILYKEELGTDANDTLDFSTSTTGVMLVGGLGSDTLIGGKGDDFIIGAVYDNNGNNTDADVLKGGKGNDTLIGGAGSTIYVYDYTVANGNDIIMETEVSAKTGTDVIAITNVDRTLDELGLTFWTTGGGMNSSYGLTLGNEAHGSIGLSFGDVIEQVKLYSGSDITGDAKYTIDLNSVFEALHYVAGKTQVDFRMDIMTGVHTAIFKAENLYVGSSSWQSVSGGESHFTLNLPTGDAAADSSGNYLVISGKTYAEGTGHTTEGGYVGKVLFQNEDEAFVSSSIILKGDGTSNSIDFIAMGDEEDATTIIDVREAYGDLSRAKNDEEGTATGAVTASAASNGAPKVMHFFGSDFAGDSFTAASGKTYFEGFKGADTLTLTHDSTNAKYAEADAIITENNQGNTVIDFKALNVADNSFNPFSDDVAFRIIGTDQGTCLQMQVNWEDASGGTTQDILTVSELSMFNADGSANEANNVNVNFTVNGASNPVSVSLDAVYNAMKAGNVNSNDWNTISVNDDNSYTAQAKANG